MNPSLHLSKAQGPQTAEEIEAQAEKRRNARFNNCSHHGNHRAASLAPGSVPLLIKWAIDGGCKYGLVLIRPHTGLYAPRLDV